MPPNWQACRFANTMMLQGTPEVVRQKSAELISIAGKGGGFILSPGCEVPRDTPPENMLALVEAAVNWPLASD